LERHGIERRADGTESRFDEEQEMAICHRYLSGLSSEKVGREYGCAATTVQSIVKRYGFELRSVGRYREHACDDAYFDETDAEDKAYWLGFFAADGTVVGNVARVKLAARDRDHLFRLKEALRCTNPVSDTVTDGFRQSYLTVTSRRLVQGLAANGVVPRKGDILEWPSHLNPPLLRHYLRGYVDGDGGFYAHRYGNRPKSGTAFIFSFVSSRAFCEGARRYLAAAADVHRSRMTSIGSGKVFTLRYAGQPQVYRIYHLLYDEATVYLPRKRENVADYVRCTAGPMPSLRNIRTEHGLSQRALHERSGVALSSVQRLETGGTATPSTITRLADALGVDPYELTK
jgi:DNA-binding XRE family transcriptional regulator